MKIYIARHGETQWNTQRRMQGWGNSDLTDLGVSQATLLGKSLIDIDYEKVISSPLGRTLATTKHILGERELDVVVDENFKEMGFGCWEGVEPDVLKEQYEEQHYNFWNAAHQYVPVDGETFETVYERVIKGIHDIVDSFKDNSEGNILLVTHGMIIKILLLHIKGLPLDKLWDSSVVHPSSLTVIEVDQDYSMKIVVENDVGHLENQ